MSAVFCSSSAKAIEINNTRYNPNIGIITQQPTDYYGEIGQNGYFSVVAQGGSTYQWQYKLGDGDWTNSGAQSGTSSTLTFLINANRFNYLYRCIVTNQYGQTEISYVVRCINTSDIEPIERLTISDALVFLGDNIFAPLFNFNTPWGITFGAVIVGVFGAPLLVKAYKKFF